MGYDSINQQVLDQVPPQTKTALDLGCGEGSMGSLLKESLHCSVVGVTHDEEEAAPARARLDRVIVADLNAFDPRPLGQFDCILCSHVLEHLHCPDLLLESLRNCLTPSGVLIVALPNILFWKQRLQFLRGQFRYTDGGVMDKTHYRFFDWVSAGNLLADAGFTVTRAFADGGIPFSKFLWPAARGVINQKAQQWFPGLIAWQFVFTARLKDGHRSEAMR